MRLHPRLRDLGLQVGDLPTGRYNAITDVANVKVGHATVRDGTRIRTGVTVVIPGVQNPLRDPAPAGLCTFNGYGKMTGSMQLNELGRIETPVALTATLSTWRVADALLGYVLGLPGNEDITTVNPVVLETNDSRLSDARVRPVGEREVLSAIASAVSAPVQEGSVGGGTGSVALGYKAGIGSASRLVDRYTVGVLVQANFGGRLSLLQRQVTNDYATAEERDGSCVFVLATDAPATGEALRRIAARTILGLARSGSSGAGGSGDYCVAFTTARADLTSAPEPLDRIFLAAADCAEESIYNALLAADPEEAAHGIIPALSAEDLAQR